MLYILQIMSLNYIKLLYYKYFNVCGYIQTDLVDQTQPD